MSKNTLEQNNDSPDSVSSDYSREFWEIRREDVQHCINGLRSTFYIGLALVMIAVGAHYCRDGKTENSKKGKIGVGVGQTEMYPQTPPQKDFSQRDSKFLE